jgi:tRNA(Ile)-lysidine synthase
MRRAIPSKRSQDLPGTLPPKLHPSKLHIDAGLFKPGMRLAVALSGGADSVALLCALAERSGKLGLVLHAAHLHHGLRGAEADGDLEFCRALAARLSLPFHEARVDVAAEAQANPKSGKRAETIEEAARRLRYAWFRQLMAAGEVDAVATAHTLDDQAETVLAKFLRGAWTEGLSGIHPTLEGPILRPLLGTSRAEIEAYLHALGQSWREDSSNRHLTFTRNRIRHELLPLLEGWNPRLREHLAQMAALARDEEAWWQAEVARLAPQILMQGRPVRGGGRTAGLAGLDPSLSIDVTRLAELAPALQRRLLRFAAGQLGAAPDFAATEALRALALGGRAGQKSELAQGLRAERTHRELRLAAEPIPGAGMPGIGGEADGPPPEYTGAIPGEIDAPAFGLRLRIDSSAPATPAAGQGIGQGRQATLRNWRPGDRVTLRYSSGPRKVKEVLERLRVTGSGRALWPVLELDGRIVWMRGVELQSEPGIAIEASFGPGISQAGAQTGPPKADLRRP